MVVFPLASAALACAVGMQQSVEQDNGTANRPLGLRVGLSAGEATEEGGDYFGDPVIEAARLCAKAGSGQILVSDLVRSSAGRRSSHSFSAVGALELKGLPEPLETLEVAWEPIAAESETIGVVPLPSRLARPPGVGVIGRENELQILEDSAKRAYFGAGREIVLVSGEPGQGKTTLVAELARRTHESGALVLLGRCDEEVGAPYRPFHEALTHLVAHADESILRVHVAAHGGELARLVPALEQRLGGLPDPQSTDADTERYLLFAATVGLLEQASAQTPVAVVLDDLHWADKPSLQLLRHIVANTSAARILIIGTYRDAELSAGHPLTDALAALHREPAGVSSIALKGFDDSDVVTFMESAAGHELDDTGVVLAHELYHETDGNPFFVYEMLRHLTESGAIVQDATGRWVAAPSEGGVPLPHSVRSVIGTRVARLGDQAVTVLSSAAVIGREFDLDVLAEVTGIEDDVLIDLLDAAEHVAVVREVRGMPGRYGFSHALIQHSLYEDLGPTRLARMHGKVGDALERLNVGRFDDRLGELARHFLLATRPVETDKAIAYAYRAGSAALEALAPDEAVRYFEQALDLTDRSPGVEAVTRIDLLIGLGTALRQTGVAAFRETLLEAAHAAKDVGDSDRLVAAALANSRGFATLGKIDTEKVEVLEAALDELGDADSIERARVLGALCSEIAYGSLERRLLLATEAKAMARRLGDAATLVAVINDCSVPLRIPAELERTLVDAREALEVAERLADPVARFWTACLGLIDATRVADFRLAEQCISTMDEMDQRLCQPALQWSTTYTHAAQSMMRGDTARAEELATIALQLGTESGQPDAFTFYGTQLMAVRHQQGMMGEFVPTISQVAEENPDVDAYRSALAAALLQSGDTMAARQRVTESANEGFTKSEDAAWLTAMLSFSRVPIELGMVEEAGLLLERLSPYHGQLHHDGILCLEPVAMFLGGLSTVVGRYDDSARYLQEARDLSVRANMKFAEASTELLWGRLLLTRGDAKDRGSRDEHLRRAMTMSKKHGYAFIEQRASEALGRF